VIPKFTDRVAVIGEREPALTDRLPWEQLFGASPRTFAKRTLVFWLERLVLKNSFYPVARQLRQPEFLRQGEATMCSKWGFVAHLTRNLFISSHSPPLNATTISLRASYK
jgi:hypothetical protein